MGNDIEMSTKKISAGDTLTVGDLTDDHLGAVIEVGPIDGITSRIILNSMRPGFAKGRWVYPESSEHGVGVFGYDNTPVTVIAPPPVVQPDEPKILGQCIRIEGDDEPFGFLVWPSASWPFYFRTEVGQWIRGSWSNLLDRAGDRRIIVSGPPRWPDETPAVPERIEVGEWPDYDDTHLREWKWVDYDGDSWRWYEADDRDTTGWRRGRRGLSYATPFNGPFTRGGRVE